MAGTLSLITQVLHNGGPDDVPMACPLGEICQNHTNKFSKIFFFAFLPMTIFTHIFVLQFSTT
jgi:hypothetical protein